GWFVALAPGIIPNSYRAVLQDPLLCQDPRLVGVDGAKLLSPVLQLIEDLQRQPGTVYSRQSIYSLLSSFTGMVASFFTSQQGGTTKQRPRTRVIAQEFR